jgi:hypothetical protein
MGENHKENILKCLRQWHDITLKQSDVLAAGDLLQFERLNRVSIVLQTRFGSSLSHLKPARLDKEDLHLLKEIQACQARFIEEIGKGGQEVAKAIGNLRKNKSSLNGYRQNSAAIPRFKSERT